MTQLTSLKALRFEVTKRPRQDAHSLFVGCLPGVTPILASARTPASAVVSRIMKVVCALYCKSGCTTWGSDMWLLVQRDVGVDCL